MTFIYYKKDEHSDEALANVDTIPSGDGFVLYVAAGVKPDKPVQIINLFEGYNDMQIKQRNLIIVEAGSSVDLLVKDYTHSDEPYTCDDVTEVALGEAATLEMVRLQHVNGSTRMTAQTNIQQAASSKMRTHYVVLGGKTVSNSLKVKLEGKNAEHFVGGLSLTQQNEHIDNDILMVHASPECQSNQLFRHILSDTSTGAFTGCIVVDKGARKTVAYQKSNNILLHPKAKMNIQPQLEIYADDVKCSHGATVGQLDAEALFYLRSRGISEDGAKKILLHAFADEVLNQISCESFRASALQLIEQKMENALTC